MTPRNYRARGSAAPDVRHLLWFTNRESLALDQQETESVDFQRHHICPIGHDEIDLFYRLKKLGERTRLPFLIVHLRHSFVASLRR